MNKYKAVLEYDGTAYHGWQLQKGVPTVQGTMEQALERILGRPTRVHGAGRTDSGVHAAGQVAHFLSDWQHSALKLRNGCNSLLPPDITVVSIQLADQDFHARHSAHSKNYSYSILNRPLRSSLHRLYSWHLPQLLDRANMDEASGHLTGIHDFAAFGSPTDGTLSTVREMFQAGWTIGPDEGMLQFTVCGTGFLRYMVRSFVGTLVLVGRNKISPTQFLSILMSCDRSRSGPTAPPHGLCLQSVVYENRRDE
jgi:tRNA pseudouridine38-40 synthase